jgi:2-polyprenyl-3-methyl-5-hydroxy-6-metoxy-1,4-benzoquinol methylase
MGPRAQPPLSLTSEPSKNYTGERYDPSEANALAEYDHRSRYHFVRKHFSNRGSLLDMGCGVGVSTRFLEGGFERVVGVDISPEAVDQARRLTKSAHVSFEVLDAYLAKPEPEQFDVVTCLEVIEHTLEQDRLITLVTERLKDGGVAIFSTPNVLHTRAHGIENPFHVKELTRAEFQAALSRHFRHVQLLVQVQINGVLVAPAEADPSAVTLEQVCESGGDPATSRFDDDVTTNFIAVCSQTPLSPIPGILYLDPHSTYVEQLQAIIQEQAAFVDARDCVIASQSELIKARDEAIAAQTRLIDARDRAIAAQTELIDDRDRVLASQGELISARDEALAAQARMIEARDEAIHALTQRAEAAERRLHHRIARRLNVLVSETSPSVHGVMKRAARLLGRKKP